jgi:VanZ family protein
LKLIKIWILWGWLQVAVVVYLSLASLPPDLPGFQGGDKVMHFAAYFFMMFWFGMCYKSGRVYNGIGLGLVVVGVVLEFVQNLTGYRTLSIYDMAANMTGVITGWLLARSRLSMALVYIENRAWKP